MSPARRERLGRGAAAALAALLFALVFAPLLDPATRIAPRDFVQFHLPLYASFARLAEQGLPEWNPDLWGGQPVLSNPNYAPFYPPTWLVLAADPAYGFQIGFALHGLFAGLGAALLVRRLGGRASAAGLAAIAFGMGGWMLGLVHAGRSYFGMAWWPWLLIGAHAVLTAADRRGRRRAGLGLAGAVAALALAGEPATLLVGIGTVALALLLGEARQPGAAWRGAASGALGLALGAVAIVPAFARLAASARGSGLAYERATAWSFPPTRLVEIVFPRFFGDPTRLEEGLFFGWTVSDKQFPYLLLITPGALLLAFGLAALLGRRAIPWRRVWTAGALAGIFIALGRHNPLFAWLWHWLPGLSAIRYPEKFLLATIACLTVAGALAWGRLLDERERHGRAGEADLPAALAACAAAVALALAAALALEPRLARWFVTTMAPIDPASPLASSAALYLTRQAWLAAALHAAAAAVALAPRLRRLPVAACALAAVALLAGEQALLARRIFFRVPAAAYLEPPPLAARAAALPGRIWSNAELVPEIDVWINRDRREFEVMRTRLERLDPSAGAIWGLRYALVTDFDLTLTAPARRAVALLAQRWARADRDLAYRLLGAWSVGKLAIVKDRPALARELARAKRRPDAAELRENPYLLPEARFVAAAESFPDATAAEQAALAAHLPLHEREFLIAPGARPPALFDPRAAVTALAQRGDEIEVGYRAPSAALLVVAATFDAGWSAAAAGVTVPIWETATGMMAILLPPGEGRVTLRYRDPWVRVGAAASASALLVGALIWLRSRRRDPAPVAP